MGNIMPTKIIAAVFVLLSFCIAKAENRDPIILHPTLVSSATSIDEFAPAGWKLEHSLENDFNSDGKKDAVFIIRKNYDPDDPDNPIVGETVFDAMNRTLVIALKQPNGEGYKLAFQSDTFIPVRNTPDLEEHLDVTAPLETKLNGFTIYFDLFYAAGSWEMQQRTFQFEFRDGRFVLDSFERITTNRSSGKTNGVMADYDKKRANITTGNIADDEPNVTFKKINIPKLFEISDVKDAFNFDAFSGDIPQ